MCNVPAQSHNAKLCPPSAGFPLVGIVLLGLIGCGSVDLAEVQEGLAITLDANAKTHLPHRQTKFYIDIGNETNYPVDVHNLKIELQVSPKGDRESVNLRQSWKYRWPTKPPKIAPGRQLSISVVPEIGSGEFPLSQLREGEYEVVALVNDRHLSSPYPLRVYRPDLNPHWQRRQAARGSTERNLHRRFYQPQRSENRFRSTGRKRQ